MAKQKEESAVETSGDVSLSLAVIAGSLAATVSSNGVMKGAHDLMLALQAIRVHDAIKRVQALAVIDPEMILEPVTDVAIARMYGAIKTQTDQIKAEAEEATARELAKAEKDAEQKKADEGKKPEGGK